jgi:DNA invertase Pin-like site-specific DNA recombinase
MSGRLIGYARVSTDEQTHDPQVGELKTAKCDEIVLEYGSGADRERPKLAELLRRLAAGETLVVVRLDRLGRSLVHILTIIEQLEARKIHFRSLKDAIDTSSPNGTLQLQMLGMIAEHERRLISDRTKAGLRAAKAQGRVGGNPGLRARDPVAVRNNLVGRDQARLSRLIDKMETFMPTVRRMRPAKSWVAVVKALNSQGNQKWARKPLVAAVRRLVVEGLADARLLAPSAKPKRISPVAVIVAGIRLREPSKSLSAIAAELELMRIPAPRGGASWSHSQVKNLLRMPVPASDEGRERR